MILQMCSTQYREPRVTVKWGNMKHIKEHNYLIRDHSEKDMGKVPDKK